MSKRIVSKKLEKKIKKEKDNLTIKREYDKYTSYDLAGFLNYEIKDYQDRELLLVNIFDNNSAYYEKYFDNYFKFSPKQSEGQSLNDRVCKTIEKMADYLLFSDENKPKRNQKYNYYTDEKLFDKTKKDQKKMTSIKADEYNTPIDILIKERNYKLEKKQNYCIDCETCRRGCTWGKKLLEKGLSAPDSGNVVLEDYQKLIEKCQELKKTHMCGELKTDQLIMKDKMNGTIYFKAPLNDTTYTDYYMFNFTNIEHVSALLKFNPRKIKNSESIDLVDLIYDLNNYLDKCELTDTEKSVLKLWREDDITQENISEELDINRRYISSIINKISIKIIKQYEKEKEEYIYLNYIKGKYKKCSKCGDVKLVNKFPKDSNRNDGLFPYCKGCN